MHAHYCSSVYSAVRICVKASLLALKKCTCLSLHQRGGGSQSLGPHEPSIQLNVQLSIPYVLLSPSLTDVQRALDGLCSAVLCAVKDIHDWRQGYVSDGIRDKGQGYASDGIRDRMYKSYYEAVTSDVVVVRIVLLLSGVMKTWSHAVDVSLKIFARHDWLWKDDRDFLYRTFVSKNPSVDEFEFELQKLSSLESEVNNFLPYYDVGILRLDTLNFKLHLDIELRMWKELYSSNVHMIASEKMRELYEYMHLMKAKLDKNIDSSHGLQNLLTLLREVKEKDRSIDLVVRPVMRMYSFLDIHLPKESNVFSPKEINERNSMVSEWNSFVHYAQTLADSTSTLQITYKNQLICNVRAFGADIRNFCRDFEENSPQRGDLFPDLAMRRIDKCDNELKIMEEKMKKFNESEDLFGLQSTIFAEMVKVRREVNLRKHLYSLWSDVDSTLTSWLSIRWSRTGAKLSVMSEIMEKFDFRLKKLPTKLREWAAYSEMKHKLGKWQSLLPVIIELRNSYIKERHWEAMNMMIFRTDVTEKDVNNSHVESSHLLPYKHDCFSLSHILHSNILVEKECVLDICNTAHEEFLVEQKVHDLESHWSSVPLELSMWRNGEVPVISGYESVLAKLEGDQIQIQSMLSSRHVAPIRSTALKLSTLLYETVDTLELWLKVQSLWVSLKSVFFTGDLARKIPLEAKMFLDIDRQWVILMSCATESCMLLSCCGSEITHTSLPVLYSDLEKCQKSLKGYFKLKRSMFPRYFCNLSLLLYSSSHSLAFSMYSRSMIIFFYLFSFVFFFIPNLEILSTFSFF